MTIPRGIRLVGEMPSGKVSSGHLYTHNNFKNNRNHASTLIGTVLQYVVNDSYHSPQNTYILFSRVSQCLSPRPNWGPPTTSPASECVHPKPKGGTNSAMGEGRGVPIPTTGEKD